MLARVLAGESPAGGNCPVATVVISGGRNGDGPAGSPEVKVSVGLVRRGAPSRERKGQWVIRPRRAVSDPPERQATRQVVAEANQSSPEIKSPLEADGGGIGNAESVRERRRPAPLVCEGTGCIATDGIPGVIEDDMPRKNIERKHGTTRRSPRPAGTAKTTPINRRAAKWRCAGEWGGWARLSVDGPGHYNPDRSEGPWGRGKEPSNSGTPSNRPTRTQSRGLHRTVLQRLSRTGAKGGGKLGDATCGRRPGRHHLTGWP